MNFLSSSSTATPTGYVPSHRKQTAEYSQAAPSTSTSPASGSLAHLRDNLASVSGTFVVSDMEEDAAMYEEPVPVPANKSVHHEVMLHRRHPASLFASSKADRQEGGMEGCPGAGGWDE